MLLMMAVEFDATGAFVICLFHGLLEGNNCCPSRLGRTRSSSNSDTPGLPVRKAGCIVSSTPMKKARLCVHERELPRQRCLDSSMKRE